MLRLLLLASIASLALPADQKFTSAGHVIVIASPMFGHMIPSLDFAKRLSAYHYVTYVVSASKLVELERRGLISNNTNYSTSAIPGLELVGLLDNNDQDNEVVDAKLTVKVETVIEQMREPLTQLLSSVPIAPSLHPDSHRPFSRLLSTRLITRPVHLIISPWFNFVSTQIAHQRQIPVQIFLPNSLQSVFHFINMSTGSTISPTMSQQFTQNVIGALPLADGLICNSIAQLDKSALDLFREQSFLPVRFVGPLFSETDATPKSEIVAHVRQWLDTQWNKASQTSGVIYLAFGSLARLTAEQVTEIGHAIAPYRYIWSLKSDLHKYVPISSDHDQMHLILGWTPQRLILSHPAVYFFLSHGGWNSILESMSAGKPLLVWPMFGDQFLNGNRVEHEFGIGKVIQNTRIQEHQRLVLADEVTQYLHHMFDHKTTYIERARQLQSTVLHAKENKSREHFDEIVKLVNNQVEVNIRKEEL